MIDLSLYFGITNDYTDTDVIDKLVTIIGVDAKRISIPVRGEIFEDYNVYGNELPHANEFANKRQFKILLRFLNV